MKHNKNKLLLIFVVFVCAINILEVLREYSSQEGLFAMCTQCEYRTYRSEMYGFTVEYPDGWRFHEFSPEDHGDLDSIALITVPWHIWPFIEIAKKEFQDTATQDIKTWAEERLPNSDTQIIKTGLVKTDYFQGEYIVYSYTDTKFINSKVNITCFLDYFLEDNQGYVLTFCASEDQLADDKVTDIFLTILLSFDADDGK